MGGGDHYWSRICGDGSALDSRCRRCRGSPRPEWASSKCWRKLSPWLCRSFPGGKAPQVSNFGQPFPAIEFWSVPELRTAFQHLFGAGDTSANDWQVLLYAAGRAMLWLVVVSACLSMYGYFRSFYYSVLSPTPVSED